MIKYYINTLNKTPYKLENGYLFKFRYTLDRISVNEQWAPSIYTEIALVPKENSPFTEISEEEMTLLLLDRSP